MASRLEAIASRLEAIASRLEATSNKGIARAEDQSKSRPNQQHFLLTALANWTGAIPSAFNKLHR